MLSKSLIKKLFCRLSWLTSRPAKRMRGSCGQRRAMPAGHECLETRLLLSAVSITEFVAGVSLGASPAGITPGPDGNLWFAETADRIGRITPTGVVTEFSGITAGSTPVGIVAGPDGNLLVHGDAWQSHWQDHTGGAVTESLTPGITPGVSVGIAAGADGNLWFTESSSNRIGRITPAGVVTEFSAGITAGRSPYGITAGPDGNLWFTETAGNRIGRNHIGGCRYRVRRRHYRGQRSAGHHGGPRRQSLVAKRRCKIGKITTAGAVTEFAIGSPGSLPFGITNGPDGNLWFTEQIDRIGRITPAGRSPSSARSITAGANPYGITAGPDGNLWFTETAGRIGRVSISPPLITTAAGNPLSQTDLFFSGIDQRVYEQKFDAAQTTQGTTLTAAGRS